MLLFVPISLVFINFLASFIIIMTTQIKFDSKEKQLFLKGIPNSWYNKFYHGESNYV